MKLRSGKIKSIEEVKRKKQVRKKKLSHDKVKQLQLKRRQITNKHVNSEEIKKIVENSSRIVVRINRMSSRKNLIEQTNQPHGELNSAVSENSDNTVANNNDTTDTGTPSRIQPIDSETVAQALRTPLPEYEERDEQTQQQQQQNVNQPPAHTRKKKMNELFDRPAKLRTDGNLAENWKNFRRQLDIFMIASELNAKTSEIKAAVVLNLVGQEAIELFDTFDLTDEQKKNYDEVLKAFETFCKPKTNELYERYMFNKRDQKEGESFDTFLMDIKRLARTCEYKDNEEMMLRDRIVFGIYNSKLRTKLLETQNLTYTTAVEKCRADEATHGYAKDMNRTTTIDVVNRDGNRKNTQPAQQQQKQNKQNKFNGKRNQQQQQRQNKNTQSNERNNRNQNNNNNNKMIENCSRCTFSHKINECPAYGKTCNKCSRPNHFSNACRERKVNTITTNENVKEYQVNLDDEFCIDTLENVYNACETDDAVVYPWIEKLLVNGKAVSFKVDSGAETDVLPLSKVKQLNDRIELQRSDIRLRGFGGNKIEPIGMCYLSLTYHNMTFRRQVAIVEFDVTPILGYYSSVKFGIIKSPKSKSLDSINKEL